MPISRYLPSAKLVSIVLSFALSAGLVYGADALTHRTAHEAQVGVDSNAPSSADAGWEAALYAVQAQTASSTLTAPDPNVVDNLLQAAQSTNITETIGKTLLINLTNAKSQGLGNDIPTQDQIIAQAAAQLKNRQASSTLYTAADLTIVPASKTSLRAYGNGVMSILSATSSASEKATLFLVDVAVERQDKTALQPLPAIGSAYAGLARSLARVPVPQTFVPLQLQVVNDYLLMSTTYADMQTIVTDPLRGLVALQTYESLMDEEARVLTNIAQELSKDGILFSKDEPGSTWGDFLAPSAVPGSAQ